MGLKKTTLTTPATRHLCCPHRGTAVASITADAWSGRAGALLTAAAAAEMRRRRAAPSAAATIDADGADKDEEQPASIVRRRRRGLGVGDRASGRLGVGDARGIEGSGWETERGGLGMV